MSIITQVLSALPAAPARSQTPTAFVASADAFIGGFTLLQTQQNALTGQINTVAGEVAANTALTSTNTATVNAANAAIAAQSPIANAASAANSASIATAAALSAASVLQQDLSAFTGALHRSPNAVVAQFIYDTSKDSDGGAWIDRMQDKSWANEPLNGKWLGPQSSETTARAAGGAAGDYFQQIQDGAFYRLSATVGVNTQVYRGNTAKFPRLSAIIAEAGSVTIYDLTAPGRPMWMRFVASSSTALYTGTAGSITSLSALNGQLVVACGAGAGLSFADFLKDNSFFIYADITYGRPASTIQNRNVSTGLTNVGPRSIVNASTNSVAMTVLPDAPIDIATGLAVPTIAVATAGGVSVLKQDGTVVNIVATQADFGYATKVAFSGKRIKFVLSYQNLAADVYIHTVDIPSANTAFTVAAAITALNGEYYNYSGTNPSILKPINSGNILGGTVLVEGAISSNSGLTLIKANPSTPTKGMVAYITNTYNTGHMVGDIRRCYLSDVSAGTISNPSTVADRSAKAAAATVYGTITKTAVGTGSQLVAYSGFSTANYLQEPYSADLDFGTGDFSISAWVKFTAAAATGLIFERSTISGGGGASPYMSFYVNPSNQIGAYIFDGTSARSLATSVAYNTGTWLKVRLSYTAGRLAILVNGLEVTSVTGAPLLTLSNSASVSTYGNTFNTSNPFSGSIALLKVSATVPTPEQALFAYGQEAAMFKDGAQVALPDAGAVQDLTYDEQQDKWVAMTYTSESSFTGLVRTATATPVPAGSFLKVSAKSGIKLLARNGSVIGVDVSLPAYGLREELIRRAEAAAKQSKTLTVFDFDAISAQTDFALPIGWRTTEVLSAGASKREGATKDWVRLYDGFRETIRFATAPGTAVWAQLTAKRE